MTLYQRNILLAFCAAEAFTSVELQKMILLYTRQQRMKAVHVFDFIPHKRGGYSFTLRHCLDGLQEKGYVRRGPESSWQTTEAGLAILSEEAPDTRSLTTEFCRSVSVRGEELVRLTYEKHPETAVRSEIANELFSETSTVMLRINQMKDLSPGVPLLSIGYEGRTLEAYLQTLLTAKTQVLCDVRKMPLSRKFGFSKRTLAAACKDFGIDYRHYPELGIPKEDRADLETQADYDSLFLRYEETVLKSPLALKAIGAITLFVEGGRNIALTCFEKLPEQCHRTRVLRRIEEKTGLNVVVK